MRSSHTVDRIDTAFDDQRLVAGARLLLPGTLALHLGLKGLADRFLDLGRAADAANVGDKLLTLVVSALGGGDSIDDADALRAGGTSRILGFSVKAPSTLGTFLCSFRWGHVRQLDAVSRHLLARAWAAGAGPGAAPFTIDLDSTICRRTASRKRGPSTTAIPTSAAITPCSRWPPARERSSWRSCARAAPTPRAPPPTSCARRSAGSGRPRDGRAHDARRLGLLWPRRRRRLSGHGCSLLHHAMSLSTNPGATARTRGRRWAMLRPSSTRRRT